MLEKSSTIIFTQDEIDEVKRGVLPERLGTVWGLTLPQAQEIILEREKSTGDTGKQD